MEKSLDRNLYSVTDYISRYGKKFISQFILCNRLYFTTWKKSSYRNLYSVTDYISWYKKKNYRILFSVTDYISVLPYYYIFLGLGDGKIRPYSRLRPAGLSSSLFDLGLSFPLGWCRGFLGPIWLGWKISILDPVTQIEKGFARWEFFGRWWDTERSNVESRPANWNRQLGRLFEWSHVGKSIRGAHTSINKFSCDTMYTDVTWLPCVSEALLVHWIMYSWKYMVVCGKCILLQEVRAKVWKARVQPPVDFLAKVVPFFEDVLRTNSVKEKQYQVTEGFNKWQWGIT